MQTPLVQGYLALTHVLGPFYRHVLSKRLHQGKEDPIRIHERFGKADTQRPKGRLIWFHAASVGEALSLEPVIKAVLARWDDVNVMVTSGTVTSAQILADTLPERAFHQFVPVDTPRATREFLRHWNPDLAVWTESEIWPRLMVETHRADIPMILINARVSEKTARMWTKFPCSIKFLLGLFDAILTQEEQTADLLHELGLPSARAIGSTKRDAAPLPVDEDEFASLKTILGTRPVWLAASTHPSEEPFVRDAMAEMDGKDALLVVAPRHPERGDEVCSTFRSAGYHVAQRSRNEPIDDTVQVYVADTIGEMGLWYRLAHVSLIGGSISPVGGHNPFEAALLGTAVLSGPHVFNFQQVYEQLDQVGGYLRISTHNELASNVMALFANSQTHQALTKNARALVQSAGTATQDVIAEIAKRI